MQSDDDRSSRRVLHGVCLVLSVLTFFLIVWGGHVNTTRSGMAFPDWPTSNNAAMLTYAPSEWLAQTDRFWEHSHRLFASGVGLITVVVLALSFFAIPRERRAGKLIVGIDAAIFLTVATAIVGLNRMPGGVMEAVMIALAVAIVAFVARAFREQSIVRAHWLAQACFATVCLQACFGGYTVRNNLPAWTSITHGMLAEIFMMMVLGVTMLTSRSWQTRQDGPRPIGKGMRNVIVLTWALTFVQFLLGALTRHMHAWGTSITWPAWSDDGFWPTAEFMQYPEVVVHILHRTTAYAVAVAVLAQWLMVWRNRTAMKPLLRTTLLAALLVGVQIWLGAMILWTARGELVTTLHVMTGVLLLTLNTLTLYNASHWYRQRKSSMMNMPTTFAGQGH